jgi:hypothetical protein
MDRRLDWIVYKGALAVALYFAMIGRVDWLHYAVAGFVGWTLVVNVREMAEDSVSRPIAPIAIPRVSAMAFDLSVLAAMFLAHWYWTAFAYAISCGCLALVQARAFSKP